MTNKQLYERLHKVLGQQLLKRIESGEATAADFQAARQFLRDNHIEAASPTDNEEVQGLLKTVPFPTAADA